PLPRPISRSVIWIRLPPPRAGRRPRARRFRTAGGSGDLAQRGRDRGRRGIAVRNLTRPDRGNPVDAIRDGLLDAPAARAPWLDARRASRGPARGAAARGDPSRAHTRSQPGAAREHRGDRDALAFAIRGDARQPAPPDRRPADARAAREVAQPRSAPAAPA